MRALLLHHPQSALLRQGLLRLQVENVMVVFSQQGIDTPNLCPVLHTGMIQVGCAASSAVSDTKSHAPDLAVVLIGSSRKSCTCQKVVLHQCK